MVSKKTIYDPDTHYVPSKVSKVKRNYQCAAYDHETVHKALDRGLLCHIGYVIDAQPYVTPTIYCRKDKRLYWHGSSASKMLKSMRDGVRVCLSVTDFCGLVLARSGFHHSANYRSVMAFGIAHLLTDSQEKEEVLDLLMERIAPGRNAFMRPHTN
ncbi:MAG: pyridoxamine 5'-phosphate oxidase family protein, partial [Pseudomonadota bacterium]